MIALRYILGSPGAASYDPPCASRYHCEIQQRNFAFYLACAHDLLVKTSPSMKRDVLVNTSPSMKRDVLVNTSPSMKRVGGQRWGTQGEQ
jgi:hypothetical protein